MKDTIAKAINWIKDAYLWLVDWVDQNPQKALWGAFALMLAALVV